MTILTTTDPSVLELGTPQRLLKLSNLGDIIYQKMNGLPKTVGLFLTPQELNGMSYVRASIYCSVGNPAPRWTRKTDCIGKSVNKLLVGWRFLAKDQGWHSRSLYTYEKYHLRTWDFPFKSDNYSPKLFGNKMETPDSFIIPSEGISIEEMLNRMNR